MTVECNNEARFATDTDSHASASDHLHSADSRTKEERRPAVSRLVICGRVGEEDTLWERGYRRLHSCGPSHD